MTETLCIYGVIVYVMLFPALIYLCWVSVNADKQTLYLWIWIFSPAILPLLVLGVCLVLPLAWALKRLAGMFVPLYQRLGEHYDQAAALVHKAGGK
jgi:hypothetical protein